MSDGFNGDAFFGEVLNGFFQGGVVFGFEFELDFADGGGDFRTADVEHDVHRLGHLINDRLFDLVGGENQLDLSFSHGIHPQWRE